MDFAFLDLLNSDWHDYRGSGRSEDLLENSGWLVKFMARWGFEAAGPPDPAARAALVALRSLLRRMVEFLGAGQQLPDDDVAKINALLTGAPAVHQLVRSGERHRVEKVPLKRDWNWVLGEIAMSFTELLVSHDPHRIKVCENPDCMWVFYDESRNQSRRWCEGSSCGNLLKVRRFRMRQKNRSQKVNTEPPV